MEKFLEMLTAKELLKFKKEIFTPFASATNRHGALCEIGVDGDGNYEVWVDSDRIFSSISTLAAIDKYKELFS